jgi:hypothetical protein
MAQGLRQKAKPGGTRLDKALDVGRKPVREELGMAKRGRRVLQARKEVRDDDSLLIRSAESLGRVIGSLQRQVQSTSKRVSSITDKAMDAIPDLPRLENPFGGPTGSARKRPSTRTSAARQSNSARKSGTRKAAGARKEARSRKRSASTASSKKR